MRAQALRQRPQVISAVMPAAAMASSTLAPLLKRCRVERLRPHAVRVSHRPAQVRLEVSQHGAMAWDGPCGPRPALCRAEVHPVMPGQVDAPSRLPAHHSLPTPSRFLCPCGPIASPPLARGGRQHSHETVEANVESGNAVCEPAYGDQVDAGGRNGRCHCWCDPARGFGNRTAADHRYCSA